MKPPLEQDPPKNQETQLDTEITESQKVRSDLLKWKILVVAALGAVGLGLSGSGEDQTRQYLDLVLIGIPPVCVYIDLLCRHISLRIQVIGRYRQQKSDPYEDFVDRLRGHGVFDLERYAIVYSSTLFSLALALLSLTWFRALPSLNSVLPHAQFISLVGVLGLLLTLFVELRYKRLGKKIEDTPSAQQPVRRPLPAGVAVVLEGRLRHRT